MNEPILWATLDRYYGPAELSGVKYLVSPTTGLNHVDVKYCADNGIRVISLSGETEFLSQIRSTAEHTILLILMLLRRVIPAIRDGRRIVGNTLNGKSVGVIGKGRIGKMVGDMLVAMGAYVEYDELSCDIVTLHANYTPENENMIGIREFGSMKDGAFFVNTARGELVDEDALIWALDNKLSGAAVDVLRDEQRYTGRLLEYAKTHDNLIVTPHMGGATVEDMNATQWYCAKKLEKALCVE